MALLLRSWIAHTVDRLTLINFNRRQHYLYAKEGIIALETFTTVRKYEKGSHLWTCLQHMMREQAQRQKMPASQCAAEIVVDASFTAKVVYECVAKLRLLREILEKPVDVSQICAIVRRCALDKFSPAFSVKELGISEAFEVFVLGLDSYDCALQEAAHGLLCNSNG